MDTELAVRTSDAGGGAVTDEVARRTAAAEAIGSGAAATAGRAARPSLVRRLARRWFEGWVAWFAEERPPRPRPPAERESEALPYNKLAGFR